jgi:hypothetical protein
MWGVMWQSWLIKVNTLQYKELKTWFLYDNRGERNPIQEYTWLELRTWLVGRHVTELQDKCAVITRYIPEWVTLATVVTKHQVYSFIGMYLLQKKH